MHDMRMTHANFQVRMGASSHDTHGNRFEKPTGPANGVPPFP